MQASYCEFKLCEPIGITISELFVVYLLAISLVNQFNTYFVNSGSNRLFKYNINPRITDSIRFDSSSQTMLLYEFKLCEPIGK